MGFDPTRPVPEQTDPCSNRDWGTAGFSGQTTPGCCQCLREQPGSPDLVLVRTRGGGDTEPRPLKMGANPAGAVTSDWVLSPPICGQSHIINCSQPSP